MDVWTLTVFFVLCSVCGLLQIGLQRGSNRTVATVPTSRASPVNYLEFLALQKRYFAAFFLALFSDWLQGPYVYKLYSSYGFIESQIAVLYVVGFASSALFGTFTGVFADRFGRRRAALGFCAVYILCCISKVSSNYQVLLVGRIFGGIATSMLFCTFESWYIYEHVERHGFPSEWMSSTFSRSTFWNGLLAIIAGVFANAVAETFGFGPVAPFLIAVPDLLVCMIVMAVSWKENYGNTQHRFVRSCTDGVRELVSDERIVVLGAIQSLFESVMYVFVFLWTPVLDVDGKTPLGLVFACFMVCIMIGSSIHQIATNASNPPERILFGSLCLGLLSMSVSFVATSNDGGSPNVSLAYVSFLVFEVAVGLYFPAVSFLRSEIVPESHRTSIMNWFRLPMNAITCIGLLWMRHGEKEPNDGNSRMFAACVALLAVSCVTGVHFQAVVSKKRPNIKSSACLNGTTDI